MDLGPGRTLGPYQVLEPLGAGGMGEVWKARDTRLERDVAIKIISHEKAGDAVLQSRFGREAKALSALNHPNIVSVYDVGEDSGIRYIVSELVRGASLRTVISAGPLPLDRLLRLAAQAATALKAAHAAGIVHRDLKPENIMVTSDDTVKILDFGLARHVRTAGIHSEDSRTETLATDPGVIMGTAGYMSPEQVCGTEVDGRSDIFSFGVILYEMATGSRAFHGRNSIETMSAILRDEAPHLPANLPSALDRTIRRCLDKEPANRFQTAAELSAELETLRSDSRQSGGTRKLWITLGTAAAVIAAGASFYWLTARKPEPIPGREVPKAVAVTPPRVPVPTSSVPPKEAAAEAVETPTPPKPAPKKPAGAASATAPAAAAVNTANQAAFEKAYEQGMVLLSSRKWQSAYDQLSEAIRLKPDATAYLGRCRAALGQENYQGAVDDCTVAIQRLPTSADAYHQRAQAYFFLEQYDKTVEDLNAAIRLGDSNLPVAHSLRGRAHSNLKEWVDAIADFDEAIRLNPNAPQFFLFRGTAYNARSQYHKAIADLDEALRLQPNMPMAHTQRAYARQQLGDRSGAAEDRAQAKSLRKDR